MRALSKPWISKGVAVLALALAALAAPGSARAFAQGAGGSEGQAFLSGTTIAFDPVWDSAALAGGLAAALGLRALLVAPEASAATLGGLDPKVLPPLDALACFPFDSRLDLLSSGLTGAALAYPAIFALGAGEGEAFPAAAAYGEALLWTYALKNGLKYLFPKARPYAYGGGELSSGLLEEARESFPSGHAALAFCAATSYAVLALELLPERPETPWLVAGGYALALGASGLRVLSGNHFIVDAAAGAALGSGVGYLVTRLHLRRGAGSTGLDLQAKLAGRGPTFVVKVGL
ncbi:MAG: phosphatase PAP2 family protein [Spirochaetaceae bacterium]|nr:phosphatase PAP2 family protein [Spirochaetaceae bacterium]